MQAQTSGHTQDNIQHVEGIMISIMQRLSQLAQHPDRASANGASLVSIHSKTTPAAEYDGMMGSLGLEAGLSGAFGAAAAGAADTADIHGMDAQNIADAASEYLKDRTPSSDTTNNQGRGRGTFALGEHKTICNTFNQMDERHAAMQAFNEDLEERIALEKHLLACDHELSLLKRQKDQPAAAFIPPAPTYAPQFGLAA